MLEKDLFFDSRSPYYIIAPPYTEFSSGIRVLHYLCHALNIRGFEAYVSTTECRPGLRTPFLTEGVKYRHEAEGREPIVVYPEIVKGNPLGAKHVVRYLLNVPGLLGGDKVFEPSDFIVQYRSEFVPDYISPDCELFLPPSDLSIFNLEGADDAERSGVCFYVNRYKGAMDRIPADAVEVSKRHPRSLVELAELFRSVELLYTYEHSAITLEAALCGCPTVYIPNETMPEFPHTSEMMKCGAAWGDSPEEIEKAKASVKDIHGHYTALTKKFSDQLDLFISKTQKMVSEGKVSAKVGVSSKAADPVALALDAQSLIGGGLDKVASALTENRRIYVSGRKELDGFYLSLVGRLLDDPVADPFGQRGASEEARLERLGSADALVHEVLGEGEEKSKATELQEEIFGHRQNLRYQRWIQAHGLKEVDGHLFAERMMYQWSTRPVFHFVLFLFPGDEALLGDTLDSLSAQFYQDWRLTIIADAPVPDPLWEEIDSLQWVQCGPDDDPYQLVNDAVGSIESDWVSFIEAGTRWAQHALLRIGDYANLKSSWSFIYTDTDEVNEEGERSNPRFLPDINLDMLRSTPYCRQGAWVRRSTLLEVGGFEPLPGCEMHDLVLKTVESQGESAVGHVADVLVHMPKAQRQPDEAIVALTVKNHLVRSGVSAVVGNGYLPGTLRINYLHTEEAPASIIIPTRDKFEYIESCIKSLLQRTAYENFEIIIADMGSKDPDTLALYDAIDQADDASVTIIRLDEDITVAEACNSAAIMARGDYLVFLKNHVEARQDQWLSRLMLHAQRPEVGVVGPRIVYPESTLLFDAGMVLGLDDVVGKPFVSQLTLNGRGYMGRAQIDQNYSAISDTCLVVRKSLFTDLGGMDGERLGGNFLDVDLCLRVADAGYKVVWTPFSLLMAYKGNATINERGKGREYLESAIAYDKSRDALLEKWLLKIANDPAYNPNLDLSPGNAFLVNDKLPLNWDVNFHERTRVLGLPLRGGSGDYRIIQPFDAISHAALQQTEHHRVVEGMGEQMKMVPVVRMDPDVLVVQAGIDDMHVSLLNDISRHTSEIFRVFSLDDLVTDIPDKSSVYKHFTGNFRNARARLRKALSLCDRMIVTTRPLADAYADMIDDIRVIPNRLRRDVWLPLESKRGISKKPRVGWVGAQQHAGDLEIIIDVVKQTADKVDWVFMGMCPEEIRHLVKEYDLEWVSYDKYPKKMASLHLDVAIAPLEINRFNEAKSNLRLLEYGILGWPVICTDIVPYQSFDAPVRRVPNETDAWVDAIMDYANNLNRAAKDGDKLRSWVKRYFILEDHLDEWVRALTPVNSRVSVVQPRGARKVS